MAEATGLRFTTRVLDGGLGLGITMQYVPRMGSPEALAKLLIEELRKRNIVFGIDEAAILRITTDKVLNEEVVVAQGVPSTRGRDAELELMVVPPSFMAQAGEDGRVDYKNVENVAQVKAGDLISRGTAADPGQPGTNIFGKEIRPPAVRERIRHPAGKNTVVSEDGTEMRAAKDGFLRWNGERIDVADVYRVDQDVDLRTGNVHYQGDVEVPGDVKPGFEVVAGGNVLVLGVVDGARVVSEGGSVTVWGGVLGSGEGEKSASVTADGNIQIGRARFARLESKTGNVVANNAVEHSEIHAARDLILHSGQAMNCVIEVGGKVDVASLSFDAESALEKDQITQSSSRNRRKYLRVVATPPIEVQLLHEASKQHVTGAIQALSAGGMKVRLAERIRENRQYQLQFKLPAVDGTMWMDAEVVRMCEPLDDEPAGTGVSYALQFVHIEPAVRETLAKFCLAEDLRQHRLIGKSA